MQRTPRVFLPLALTCFTRKCVKHLYTQTSSFASHLQPSTYSPLLCRLCGLRVYQSHWRLLRFFSGVHRVKWRFFVSKIPWVFESQTWWPILGFRIHIANLVIQFMGFWITKFMRFIAIPLSKMSARRNFSPPRISRTVFFFQNPPAPLENHQLYICYLVNHQTGKIPIIFYSNSLEPPFCDRGPGSNQNKIMKFGIRTVSWLGRYSQNVFERRHPLNHPNPGGVFDSTCL